MPSVSYRKAREEDFPKVSAIIRSAIDDLLKQRGLFEVSPFASPRLPPIPQQGFPWFEMALKEDPEGFWVAEAAGELVAMTLSWVRGSLWFLAQLFVSPGHQGLDIGRSLMDKSLLNGKDVDISNRALVTFAYNPVSISLYSKYGIFPRAPLYFMEGPSELAKEDSHSRVSQERVEDFEKDRDTFSRIDRECLGYPRERNHEFIFGLQTVHGHVFRQGDKPVGYSYVWKNGRVGPLAVVSQSILPDIVKASLALAAKEGPTVGMLVAGPNEALMKIVLDQKMRIADSYLFMSSRPFPNFSNYVLYPTGAML